MQRNQNQKRKRLTPLSSWKDWKAYDKHSKLA